MSVAGEPSLGSGEAKVVLVEFSDYQCPYCAQYAREILPRIRADYIDTGKVRYVFRDYPLSSHPAAARAAEAAHCAGEQGRFWEMHDVLFANSAGLGADALPAHAKSAGVEEKAFARCLASGRFAAGLREDMADADAAGIRGTPAFFVGLVQPGGRLLIQRKLSGLRPYSDYRAVLETALGTP
jgi:protein-disulfide isomerase